MQLGHLSNTSIYKRFQQTNTSSPLCFIFPEMASTPFTKKIGPSGGMGGQVKDMNVDGITRIVKIAIHSASCIDAFTVTFLRNGHEESTVLGAGTGGTLQEFDLQPTENIISVNGYYGNYGGFLVVRSLKFETSLGKTFGPYGTEQVVPFVLDAITGHFIGFHARSAAYIDAFGAYVKAHHTTGGSNGGENTGDSTGTGSTWAQSDANFWDRPVSGA